MINISIESRHDPVLLGQELQRHGRLQIPNFLPEETAEALRDLLLKSQTWFTTYNNGGEHFEVYTEDLAKLGPQQRQEFMQPIMKGAQDGFQYFFQQYYITEALKYGREPGHPLHFMQEQVNTDAFLNFMRTLTGVQQIDRSDCFASRYLPGHFLTEHDDTHDNEDRVAAYTISLTKNWKPDWGGNLAFYDGDGNITGGFKPSFNTLNIFMVPQPHAVQSVAPFAAEPRISFLGWLKR